MEWTDDGIVLGTRRHGETSAIVEVMTRDHGRHLGLVRGGGGTRLRPLLQPGNTVRVVWRARLDEHLGHYAVEPLHLHGASQLAAAHVVYGVTHLGALCRLLPERDPHPEVHDHLAAMLEHLDDPLTAGLEMVRFELQMLVELGFGLDLASCAATGAENDLGYVSPKSGRAVSRVAAAPWHDRLFRLLPERDPHPEVHDHLAAMLEHLDDPLTAGLEMVRFELQMLVELGFGLDLASCAATGAENDLGYVSPKSGRAVSRVAAAPWQDRLFRLPAFLSAAVTPSLDDIADGFALTGYFLARHVLEPRGLAFADAREGFVAAVLGRPVSGRRPPARVAQ